MNNEVKVNERNDKNEKNEKNERNDEKENASLIELDLIKEPIKTGTFFIKSIQELNLTSKSNIGWAMLVLFLYMLFPIHVGFIFYWFFLGIMSSIGIGWGCHTGLLFLFPYIINIAMMNGPDNIWTTYKQIYFASFIWAVGSALGELPPYYFAKAAKDNNKNVHALDIPPKYEKYITMYKDWIINYAFAFIFINASYPNMLFDICGLAAGFFGIPVYTFLLATLLGKVFVKTNFQIHILVLACFPDKYLTFIPQIVLDYFTKLINNINNNLYDNDEQDSSMIVSVFSFLWSCIIFMLMSFFIKSFIENMANQSANRNLNKHI